MKERWQEPPFLGSPLHPTAHGAPLHRGSSWPPTMLSLSTRGNGTCLVTTLGKHPSHLHLRDAPRRSSFMLISLLPSPAVLLAPGMRTVTSGSGETHSEGHSQSQGQLDTGHSNSCFPTPFKDPCKLPTSLQKRVRQAQRRLACAPLLLAVYGC